MAAAIFLPSTSFTGTLCTGPLHPKHALDISMTSNANFWSEEPVQAEYQSKKKSNKMMVVILGP